MVQLWLLEAEGLYSLNDDIAAEREAISAAQGSQGSASSPAGSYASPNNGGGGGGQASYDGGRQGRVRTGKK